MANTYNYLKNVYQDIKLETKENPAFLFLFLVLFTIPLGYAVNGMAVGLFALVTLVTFKKKNFKVETNLVLPILLYLLMAVSILWSRDVEATSRAISKVLPLLILPLAFMMMPKFSEVQKRKIIHYYSIGILTFTLFYLIRALIKFIATKDSSVFFYHELVTEDVNAIHVSVYVTLAFFCFFRKASKNIFDKVAMCILAGFIFLLSSKNIMLVFVLLVLFYELFYFRATQKIKWITIILVLLLSGTVIFSSKIRDRFLIEFQSNQEEGTVNQNFKGGLVYNVSVQQAWSKDKFQPNEYFAGAAFRIYQMRIFKEMLQEDNIFFSGYGLNATDFRIEEKAIEHNIFLGNAMHEGYQKKNFHNQYIQIFAETGVFGLLLLLLIVIVNLRKAINTKDFIHFCFAVLMISLFLTESFLARQRGVVFFTAIYCLFNSGYLQIPLNKNNL
ncbi:ABC-type multidrug transport system fused ATPase/permease subunit [Flavobacterium arsenatis]|uniref:ABC-type multidrug transport system fused ATPase/permease subunit n=1 Tax=Flavobacterium arsenatis TaxID=1484332 RepID=A0ABU1TSC2_9FLAO|nr:O-antigen ligase family protein [Flavobacterium arsenatis]MDR6968742.1 ABC-type multidrug transport system fused ATPase/permease subunit [Flavobacterium arsenatis]